MSAGKVSGKSAGKPRVVHKAIELPEDAPKYRGSIVEDDLVRPGGKLLAMLSGRAQELGHGRTEMASHIGVSYGYIAQLNSGHRKPEHMSAEVLEDCAKYLGVPKLMVLVAAGIVKPEDTLEKPEELESALPAALQFIARDPTYGPMMPQELTSQDATTQMRFFIVKLYEGATGRKLIRGERSVENIMESIGKMEERRLELIHPARHA